MNFKEIIKITLNLVMVFIFAGVILALVYAKAEPQITLNKKVEKENALKALIPAAANITSMGTYQPLEDKTAHYYKAVDAKGNVLGYIAGSYSKGYSSILHMLVAVGTDMRVKAIKILDEGETPGLGDDIHKKYFDDRFKGKSLDQLVVVKDVDPTKIQAITGATISSKACTKGVRAGVKFIMKQYGVGGQTTGAMGNAAAACPPAAGSGSNQPLKGVK